MDAHDNGAVFGELPFDLGDVDEFLEECLDPDPMVLVEFYDFTGRVGWWDKEVAEKELLVIVEVIGWLVNRDEDVTRVACSKTNEGVYGDLNLIPTGCVKSIKRLRVIDDFTCV